MIGIRDIVKMFENESVCLVGLKGRGKDMLFANVVARRALPYVSNTDYTGNDLFIPYVPDHYDCGKNTYQNFIDGKVKKYIYPHPDDTDIYIADCGIYFPAQYCNQLNQRYGYMSTLMALSRHLGFRVHTNCQNLNRVYDKIREHSDVYIMTMWCKVFFGKWVVQHVRIYEKYQSCVDRVPPYFVPRPLINRDRIQRWELDFSNYQIQHGQIKSKILIYKNLSSYNTRAFKEMLADGQE